VWLCGGAVWPSGGVRGGWLVTRGCSTRGLLFDFVAWLLGRGVLMRGFFAPN